MASSGPEREYDVIVVGGGVNGLTAAIYLQKAGLRVACFERKQEAGAGCCTEEVMHPGGVLIDADELATAALRLLEQRRITSLMIVDGDGRVEGVLHLHDLWGVGLF